MLMKSQQKLHTVAVRWERGGVRERNSVKGGGGWGWGCWFSAGLQVEWSSLVEGERRRVGEGGRPEEVQSDSLLQLLHFSSSLLVFILSPPSSLLCPLLLIHSCLLWGLLLQTEQTEQDERWNTDNSNHGARSDYILKKGLKWKRKVNILKLNLFLFTWIFFFFFRPCSPSGIRTWSVWQRRNTSEIVSECPELTLTSVCPSNPPRPGLHRHVAAPHPRSPPVRTPELILKLRPPPQPTHPLRTVRTSCWMSRFTCCT